MSKFLALLLGITAWMVVLMPAPAGAVTCTTHYSADYRYVKKALVGQPDSKWRIMHELRYRHCKRGAKRWVDPLSVEIGCRVEKNGAADLRTTNWRMRYWDHDHHEARRKTSLACFTRDWVTKILYFPKMQKFHRCAAGSPRWKTKVKFDIVGYTDKNTSLAGHWWGYSGPVAVDC